MKVKLNVVVMTSLVVVTALFAVSAALLFLGIRRFNAAEKTALGQFQKLQQYYGRQPFPSPANVRQTQQNVELLNAWYEGLQEQLRKGDSHVVERSPSRFMTQLAAVRNDLLALAQERGTKIRPGFAFGFDRYLADGSELPPPEAVPRLTHQLMAMESMVRLLVDQRVTVIESIEREDLAAIRPVALTGVGRPAPGSRPTPGRPTDRADAEAKASDADIFSKFRFTFDFRAPERSSMAVLNQLVRCPTYAVVTSVQINRDSPIVADPPRKEEPGATDAPATVVPPPDRSERIVSGPGLEQPLRMRLVVDVYRFSGEVAGESA